MASRKITNVAYRLGEAKIYDETPYPVGTTTVNNTGYEELTKTVDMGYEDVKAYAFKNGSSTTDGVPTTLVAGIPFIAGESIQISRSKSISPFKWGETTTATKSVQATRSVTVPGHSVVTISYEGTKGFCDVPFSYTQQDTSASGGVVVADKTDGIFTGYNLYNLGFTTK